MEIAPILQWIFTTYHPLQTSAKKQILDGSLVVNPQTKFGPC